MAINDYKCDKCNFIDEYNNSFSVPKSMRPPGKCPKCGGGKMKKIFNAAGQSFDIVGYCYNNEYGKKAWKRNLSHGDQAKVLTGEKDPY